jgi:hypothetical protein
VTFESPSGQLQLQLLHNIHKPLQFHCHNVQKKSLAHVWMQFLTKWCKRMNGRSKYSSNEMLHYHLRTQTNQERIECLSTVQANATYHLRIQVIGRIGSFKLRLCSKRTEDETNMLMRERESWWETGRVITWNGRWGLNSLNTTYWKFPSSL